MTGAIRVAVVGAAGRMGSEAVRAINAAPGMEVAAEIRRGDDLAAILQSTRPHVVVEFSTPESVLENVRTALRARITTIIGATGLTPDDRAEIEDLCREYGAGALIAPNFAIGALLLMRFAEQAAKYMPDVEILEMHHERKVDAPSGTATRTAELIASARESASLPAPVGAFEKIPGSRGGAAAGGIPIHSVRLPGFVASQEVIFGGEGQRLSLRHDSIDRKSFMPGVILAVERAASLSGLVYGLENLL